MITDDQTLTCSGAAWRLRVAPRNTASASIRSANASVSCRRVYGTSAMVSPSSTRPSAKSMATRRLVSTAASARCISTTRAVWLAFSAISRPWPRPPSIAESGTKVPSKRTPLRSRARTPYRFSNGVSEIVPGSASHLSTTNSEYAAGPGRSPVRAKTTILSATVALPIGHFSPVSSQPPAVRSARTSLATRSLPWTRSESPQDIELPRRMSAIRARFCSSVPVIHAGMKLRLFSAVPTAVAGSRRATSRIRLTPVSTLPARPPCSAGRPRRCAPQRRSRLT